MTSLMKHRLIKGALLALFAAFILALTVPAAEAAEYWKAKYERFSATAGETLAVGDVVYIKGDDGEAYKADSDGSSTYPAVGIVGKGGAGDTTVEIVTRGILAGQTAASPGAKVYLSTTAGGLTTTCPASGEQPMGFVLPGTGASSTDYFVSVRIPQSAGASW